MNPVSACLSCSLQSGDPVSVAGRAKRAAKVCRVAAFRNALTKSKGNSMERGPYSMKPAFAAIRKALPAGALLFLAAPALCAQTAGIIQGVIKDDSGQAVASVYAV